MWNNFINTMDSVGQRFGEGKGSLTCLCSSVPMKTRGAAMWNLNCLSTRVPTCSHSSMAVSGWWDFFMWWLVSPRVIIPREQGECCMVFSNWASESHGITHCILWIKAVTDPTRFKGKAHKPDSHWKEYHRNWGIFLNWHISCFNTSCAPTNFPFL